MHRQPKITSRRDHSMTVDAAPDGMMDFARKAGASGRRRFIALSALRALLRLASLAAGAITLGQMVMGDAANWPLPLALLLLIVASTIAGLFADRFCVADELDVEIAVRKEVGRRLALMDTRALEAIPSGRLSVALQRHPAALATLVVGHASARTMTVIGPFLAACALLSVSWQAAAAVLAMTPVMIVFFALIGGAISRRAEAQEAAFGRLAGQFADRVRTLPTILANHSVAREGEKLADRLDGYAKKTMSVLRVAFLNAGIIDFFSSLSIAMLAVFLGLGHLGLADIPGFSGLMLWQSLFILMIAPDYFAPFRRYAEQYHAKAEGDAAAQALEGLLATRVAPLSGAEGVLADLPARGLVAITGPSGAGKTTLLRRLAGVDGAKALIASPLWISTGSYVPAGELADAIAWGQEGVDPQLVAEAVARLDLDDTALLPGGHEAMIAAGGGNLSGGQRVRLAVARAMISSRSVIADEPTAKLDSANASRVREALATLARDRLVVVATHDPALSAMADYAVSLSVRSGEETA